MKRLIWAGIFAVAVVVAVALYWRLAPGTPVRVAAARVAPLKQFVEEQAKTRLPRDYVISMPYNGRVANLTLEVGDPVSTGDVVARLVEEDLKLKLDEAKALVQRVQASLRESQDMGQEQVMLKQAKSLVVAMAETVRAAAAREVSSRAHFEVADRVRERNEQLFKKGAVTEEALDQARLSAVESDMSYEQDRLVRSAMESIYIVTAAMPPLVEQMMQRRQLSADVVEGQLDEAQRQLAQVELDVTRGTLKSPVDGVVLERAVFNEQTLSAGTLLLRLGRLEDLEVEAEILSQDVVQIRPDDVVEIVGQTIGPEPALGRVRLIYPAGFTKTSALGVEEQRVKVVIDFAPGERERLRRERDLGSDYRVWVRIVVDQKPSALQIPRTALFRDSAGHWQVLVAHDRVLKTKQVELGLMGLTAVEVTEGLASGDLVVVAPEANLVPGLRVKPIE